MTLTSLNKHFIQLKDYQWLLLCWLVLLCVICTNCTIYSVLIAKERADFIASMIWALREYGIWLLLTPIFCQSVKQLTCSTVVKLTLLGAILIPFSLIVHVLVKLEHGGLETWSELLFLNWHKHAIAYVSICGLWYIHIKATHCEPTIQHNDLIASNTDTNLNNDSATSINPKTAPTQTILLDGQQIEVAKILFAQASGNYVEIHTGVKTLVVRTTMKELEGLLPCEQFFRSHRSFLVNLSYCKNIVNERAGHGAIHLGNGQIVPVSKSQRAKAHQYIAAHP